MSHPLHYRKSTRNIKYNVTPEAAKIAKAFPSLSACQTLGHTLSLHMLRTGGGSTGPVNTGPASLSPFSASAGVEGSIVLL